MLVLVSGVGRGIMQPGFLRPTAVMASDSATSADASAVVTPPLIVDAGDLPTLIAQWNPILLSVQTQIDPKPSGFLEGAISVNQDSWTLDSRSQAQLDDLAQWSALLGVLGVDGKRPVVVYDNGDLKFASRVRYLLNHYGVDRAALVNGGWPALEALVHAGKLKGQAGPSPAVFVHAAARATEPPIPLAARRQVFQSLHASNVTLIDVRSPAEYDGTDPFPGIDRPGHIPGAVNLPLNKLFATATTLMAPAQLRAVFSANHIDERGALIFYCQDGARSSLGALAAVKAGYRVVKLYYLSYLDWQSDPNDPVEK